MGPQSMALPRQHPFAHATVSGDDPATKAGINSRQQEGRLGRVMPYDGDQGKGLPHHGAATSERSRNGDCFYHLSCRQKEDNCERNKSHNQPPYHQQ